MVLTRILCIVKSLYPLYILSIKKATEYRNNSKIDILTRNPHQRARPHHSLVDQSVKYNQRGDDGWRLLDPVTHRRDN